MKHLILNILFFLPVILFGQCLQVYQSYNVVTWTDQPQPETPFYPDSIEVDPYNQWDAAAAQIYANVPGNGFASVYIDSVNFMPEIQGHDVRFIFIVRITDSTGFERFGGANSVWLSSLTDSIYLTVSCSLDVGDRLVFYYRANMQGQAMYEIGPARLKFSACGPLSTAPKIDKVPLFYPNPVTDRAIVDAEYVEFFDMSGQKVILPVAKLGRKTEVDTRAMKPGIYFYKAKGLVGRFIR